MQMRMQKCKCKDSYVPRKGKLEFGESGWLCVLIADSTSSNQRKISIITYIQIDNTIL